MNNLEELILNLGGKQERQSITWREASETIYEETGVRLTPDSVRLRYKRLLNRQDKDSVNNLTDFLVQKQQLSDLRTQINAAARKISREETIKEIANKSATYIAKKFPFYKENSYKSNFVDTNREGILLLSDWHYGIEVNEFNNTYNKNVCVQRLATLLDYVTRYIVQNKLQKLHIVNMGDLIAGRIHLPLRINSQEDVISQIMAVSELLAQFIESLRRFTEITYQDCLDNHSRLEPNKKESIQLESLQRITSWYLKERIVNDKDSFKHNVTFNDNEFDAGIINFNCLGHEVGAVHGDLDSPCKVVSNVSMFTRKQYDLICTAHYHHHSEDEVNMVDVISNGSLMGTDSYAKENRLSAKPSQTLIIANPSNVREIVYKINL